MASPLAQPRMKAADLLLRAQLVARPQYDAIADQVARTGERSEEVILDSGVLGEAELLRALAAQYRTQFVSTEKLSRAEVPRSTVQMVPRRVAETLCVFPVLFDAGKNVLSIVTPDPDDVSLIKEIQLVSGAREVKAFVSRPGAVNAAIRKHHGGDPRAFSTLAQSIGHGMPELGNMRELGPQGIQEPKQDGPREIAHPAGRRSSEGGRRSSDGQSPSLLSLPPLEMPKAPSAAPRPPSVSPMPAARAVEATPKEKHSFEAKDAVEMLSVMVSLLENNRQELRGHSSHVSRLHRQIAERMNLDRETSEDLAIAAFIHDLGKMGQFHLTALNASEYEGHKVAAQKAHDTPIRLFEAITLPEATKDAVIYMYERFDGKGFPEGLVGKEIPLGARILALSDTYADLTQNTRNPYRKQLSAEEAMDVLEKHAGTIFDPGMVELVKTVVMGEGIRQKLLANRFAALVVDSDPEETTVLELRLIDRAFEVQIARTVEAAKKILAEKKGELHLVLSELDMPDGDGLELLESTRKESWGKDIAWVVHTRRQGGRHAQRAFDLGAHDYVAKPVSSDVLVAKVTALLEQRATSSQARGVSGSLSEMGLPDIVQILFHGRKTGKLTIRGNGEMGEIHFLDGNIADAILGKSRGTDAFYAMLKFSQGEFGLDPGFVPGARVIQESSEALLLEGMRRLDEGLI